MPSAFELLDAAQQQQPVAEQPPVQDSPGQFGTGLRSGFETVGSQLSNLAGGVGEAVGADQFAHDRYAQGQELAQQAQQDAPRISSPHDVHNLRDAFDYGTGLLGGMVPQAGAALAGAALGRTPVGRLIGATGAIAPMEAGDIIGRQQADPVSLRSTDAGDRLLQAGIGGVASAGLQAAVPASVEAKLAGRVEGGLAAGVAREAAVGGASAAGSEAVKQAALQHSDQDATMNPDAIAEAGIGGAIGGGALGAVGAAGQAARRGAQAIAETPSNVLSGVTKGAKDLAASAVQAGSEKLDAAAASPAGQAFKDPLDTLKQAADSTVQRAKDFVQRVAGGEDVADLSQVAGKSLDAVKAAMPKLDEERVAAVKGMADDLLTKTGLDPATRAQVAQAAQDLGNRASQAVIAKTKLAWDNTQSFLSGLKNLRQGMGKTFSDAKDEVTRPDVNTPAPDFNGQATVTPAHLAAAEAAIPDSMKARFANDPQALQDLVAQRAQGMANREAAGPQKSEDYSGIHQAIAQKVIPEIQKYRPDLMANDQVINETGDTLRQLVQQMATNPKFSDARLADLVDTFGPATARVLEATHEAVYGSGPKATDEAFFGVMNRVGDQLQTQGSVAQMLQGSLKPEVARSMGDIEMHQAAGALMDWVRNRSATDGAQSERQRFQDRKTLDGLREMLGDKTQQVLDAVEKLVHRPDDTLDQARVKTDEEGNPIAQEDSGLSTDEIAKPPMVEYTPQGGGFYAHPDVERAANAAKGRAPEHDATAQAIARAHKAAPDKTISFISARELGEQHPLVSEAIKKAQLEYERNGMEPEAAAARARRETLTDQHGIVAAEGKDVPGTLTADSIKRVAVKDEATGKTKTSHLDNPAVFKVGTTHYDAVKLVREMQRQHAGEFDAADDKGGLHRTGRMFMTGVAALQDHLGKTFEVPDHLVIDKKGTTFGQVKGLDYSPSHDGGVEKQLASLRREYAKEKDPERRAEIAQRAQDLIDKSKTFDPGMELQREEGGKEPDPFGNVHEALQGKDEGEPIHVGVDGAPTRRSVGANERLKPEEAQGLRDLITRMGNQSQSAAGKAVARRGMEVLDNASVMNKSAHRSLLGLLAKGKRPSDIASTINALHERYKNQFTQPVKDGGTATKIDTDHILKTEDYSSIKTNADAAEFLKAAHQRFKDMDAQRREIDRAAEASGEDAAIDKWWDDNGKLFTHYDDLFGRNSTADLSSFYPDFGEAETPSDTQVRAMLAKDAAPEVAAKGPKDRTDRSTSNTDARRSAQTASGTASQAGLDAARAHVDRVLDKVRTEFAQIPHAGEYLRDPQSHEDIVRVSVHAANPLAAAYHESLHAFFGRLMDQGNSAVADALKKVATSSPVLAQLREQLRGEPAALAQLRSPEEAAAYMYQYWANGQLKIGPQVKTIFTRIGEMVRKAFGIWSADERAEKIMQFFHSGEFKNAGADEVNAKLIEAGRNRAIEATRSFTKPVTDIGEALFSAGGSRLRDTGIPALRELADVLKATGRDAHDGDPGFIPAARGERARVLNKFAQSLEGRSRGEEIDALESMQNGRRAATPGGRAIQDEVQGKLLPAMLQYMKDAGVDVSKVVPKPDYFPRQYDAYAVSKNQQAFKDVLAAHGVSPKEAEAITANLIATNGAEFTVETDRPGMQHLKARKLADIPDAELAPFMRKDLRDIIGSYVTQATRRAEWARRLGDDGAGVQEMLGRARAQGADDAQIDTARKYIRAVDGTLGDTLDPTARRIMGNVMIYQNLRLLPLSIFSSVVDPHGIALRSGSIADALHAYKLGAKAIVNTFRKHVPDGEERLAEMVGTIDSTFLGSTFTQGMTGDTGRRINDVYFKYNFQEGVTRAMRTAGTTAAIKFLERHADGTASQHSRRWLAELGLRPGEVPAKLDEATIMGSDKIKAAINQFVDSAVLRPDAADRPIWQSDPHYMLISHLKQFTHSFQETILKRVVHEVNHGNYAPAMALASYVPVMIASDMLKGMIQGGGQQPSWKQDWGASDYVASGVERAGMLGVGQYAVDGPGMLAGPTLQQLADVVSYMNGPQSGHSVAVHALPGEAAFSQTKFNMADD